MDTQKYADFTLSLAAVDLIPVAFFAAGGLRLAVYLHSPLLAAGAVSCTVGGCCKVLWKFLLVLKKEDCALLPKLFRILLFGGFGVCAAALLLSGAAFGVVFRRMLAFPALVFLLGGLAGIGAMVRFFRHEKDHSARANWREETVNILAQGLLLICLLLSL